MTLSLGALVQSFFTDHLPIQKGLRLGSICSYRDTIRLFLCFVSERSGRRIAILALDDLTFERSLEFLKYLEQERGNSVCTRNQRRAALNTFFAYLAVRVPEMLAVCQRVAAIPVKRTSLPDTHFLGREEVTALFRSLPRKGRLALRDRTLLLFLYNTGARVQEVADLRIEHLELKPPAKAHLHGKGDKWRICPLWDETVNHLKALLAQRSVSPSDPVFRTPQNRPLTRFGIYKLVRRHGASFDTRGPKPRRVSPHLFRHTAACHLLEAGVEINVIRSWLGHVNLDTTNRYAELTLRAKAEALRACEVGSDISAAPRNQVAWKDDKTLLAWLNSL
ncbi:tyrosine-type recombinase/integrase [Bradyrhizobium sp. CCGUVB14]|uniref:tyrosine-type recombinase/integrase n=1 Tax=Bradyrhizobium sp. CCGUVB14 TaxID=2949628 RepID=UPI0020B3C325|nr:tyrosine-type recombinase/integrase [Bradyrhizobium sp. CCGUVB14]MCP3441160.1 site-specific integrase [Bradyrhizobium sp. CCGUVB14]MCP3441237.1 site-specific integrase [Bradyrhizobium sp. CCGUVB14]